MIKFLKKLLWAMINARAQQAETIIEAMEYPWTHSKVNPK